MTFWEFVGVAIVVCFVITYIRSGKKEKNIQNNINDIAEILRNEKGFIINQTASIGYTIIYIDDENKKWAIQKDINKAYANIYDYADLIGFEVVEDGNSIAKSVSNTYTDGNTGKAIVGGLLFGPVGAIVGSSGSRLSHGNSETTIQNTCSYMKIFLRVNKLDVPQIVIDVITSQLDKSSKGYRNILENVKEFTSYLAYIQKNA